MALRDTFGFLSLPRAGSEAVLQGHRVSHHEQAKVIPTQTSTEPTPSTARAWARVQLPSLHDEPDNSTVMTPAQTAKQLAALKILVRTGEGPPLASRPKLWYLASGGLAMRQAAAVAQPPLSFTKLAASAGELPHSAVVQMDTDVRAIGLTWRQHALFKSSAGITSMSRLVVALLAHNPNLGYSRQLTHIVGWCMVVFGPEQEEACFWTLAALLQHKLFGYCQGQMALGVRVEQEVLTRLSARKLPRLTAHLASLRLGIPTFTQPWLASLFVAQLPPTTLARVWDSMVVEGPKVLLRTGLALLKMYEQTLSSCSFPEVLRKVMDLRVSRTTDSVALMAAAFNGCGSLPGGQVHALREEAMKALAGQPARPPSPTAPTGLPRTSATSVASGAPAVSPRASNNGSAAGASSGGGGLRAVFAAGGSLSFRCRSSGTGSGTGVVTSASCSALQAVATAAASSGGPSGRSSGIASRAGSEDGVATPASREPSPTTDRGSREAAASNVVGSVAAGREDRASSGRSVVGSQLSQMLARLVGRGSGGSAEAGAAGGMRRCATTSSVPALAAF